MLTTLEVISGLVFNTIKKQSQLTIGLTRRFVGLQRWISFRVRVY